MDRLKVLSYDEFLEIVKDVSLKIQEYLKIANLKVDYVVPIMRGGLVPATYISNFLNIIKFAPFQVKHISDGKDTKIEMLFDPTSQIKVRKDSPVFLVVEGVHSTGTSAKICINALKEKFKSAKILYVSLIKEYESKLFDGLVEFEYHSKIIGENLSEKECRELSIEPNFLLFPWENIEIESTHIDDDVTNIYF